MKIAAFAKKNTWNKVIKFGEVCEYIERSNGLIDIRPLGSNLVYTNVLKELLYFQDHPEGYNQHCFK